MGTLRYETAASLGRDIAVSLRFEQIVIMSDYSTIDPILMPWAEKRGLHVYTGHRQNVVRSVTVYVWIGSRHDSTGHIWLDPPNELGLVGLHAADRGFRIDEAVPLVNLADALDAACDRLAAHNQLAEASVSQTAISPRI